MITSDRYTMEMLAKKPSTAAHGERRLRLA
jgi:hypothetical protein